jgi:hypothetical protein
MSTKKKRFSFLSCCFVRISQQVGKYFAGFANLHLLLPTLLYFPFADGSLNKPAKISGFKFPGRAPLLLVGGTFPDHPARFTVPAIFIHQRDQKIHLPFHSGRYGSPGLLVAVNSLYGDAQQLSHLLLGLVQFFAEMDTVFAVHGEFRKPDTGVEEWRVELNCHNVAYMSIEKIP